MGLRKKKPEQLSSPNAEGLRNRAKKFAEQELFDGMEQLLTNLNNLTADYKRWRTIDLLGEINLAIESMHVIIAELMDRNDNPLLPTGSYKTADPIKAVKEARQLRPF
jgi:hypothetical protein